MPRKIPIEHVHQPPGQRGSLDATRLQYVEVDCPNDDRIAEIERRLGELEAREPEQLPVPAGFDFDAIERQLIESVSQQAAPSDQMGFVVKRLEAIEGRLTELAARVDELDARPHVSEDTIRQLDDGLNAKINHMIEKHANRALGDIRSRLVTIERNTTTTVAGSDPDSAKLAKLAEIVSSLGSYVSEIESTVEQRHGALEQQYAELAEHITDTNLKTMKLSTRLYRALQALEHDADAA